MSSSPIRPESPFGVLKQTEYQQLRQEYSQLAARVESLFSYMETLNRRTSDLQRRTTELEKQGQNPSPKKIHDPLGLLESSPKREKVFDPDELSLPSVSSLDPDELSLPSVSST